jgi:hypothetical protein
MVEEAHDMDDATCRQFVLETQPAPPCANPECGHAKELHYSYDIGVAPVQRGCDGGSLGKPCQCKEYQHA